MSSIAYQIINKFDSLGLSDVLREFTKEEIETAAIEAKDSNLKKKLLLLAKNWDKAYIVLSTIEGLGEIMENIASYDDSYENIEDAEEDEFYKDEPQVQDSFFERDWDSEDYD